MIEQLEYSESIGVPRDRKTAEAALRLLGAFNAGTAFVTAKPRTLEEALREIYQSR